MTEEEFSELSAKVLTNEATEEERSKHLSVCKENQSHKATFEDMKTASGLLAENAPLAESMNSKDPEIPEFLLEQLLDEKFLPFQEGTSYKHMVGYSRHRRPYIH